MHVYFYLGQLKLDYLGKNHASSVKLALMNGAWHTKCSGAHFVMRSRKFVE